MNKKFVSYHWATQKAAKGLVKIDCKSYDGIKDFKRDPTGYYVLIKVNFETYSIEMGICDKNHNIIAILSGKKPQDIYDAAFKLEKKMNIHIFKEKTHIAYLGKELKKAEIALVTGNNSYFQE